LFLLSGFLAKTKLNYLTKVVDYAKIILWQNSILNCIKFSAVTLDCATATLLKIIFRD